MQNNDLRRRLRALGAHFPAAKRRMIRLYAAHAGFFLMLSVFPGLVLLLELLQLTTLKPEDLSALLPGFLPRILWDDSRALIRMVWENTHRKVLGISALTALWSAGRGIHGLMLGLNAVYDFPETRGYFRTRLICAGYILVFLGILVLTLGLQVFGAGLTEFLTRHYFPWLLILTEQPLLRWGCLMALQTLVFTVMYQVLPSGRCRFRQSLPGGAFTGCGWLLFSGAYSVYASRFAGLSGLYGSVYLFALGMLWLYLCMNIFFYGGVLNRILMKNMSKP